MKYVTIKVPDFVYELLYTLEGFVRINPKGLVKFSIKHCPVCGGNLTIERDVGRYYIAKCSSCGCKVPLMKDDTSSMRKLGMGTLIGIAIAYMINELRKKGEET